MNTYQIRAKKDLFNNGKCFTHNKLYTVETGRNITTEASLMDCTTINDLGEKHIIGSLWRDFELIVGNISDLTPDRFKVETTLQQSNHGGIELMMNRSCDGVYYRWSYSQDLSTELIYEAEIENDDNGAYFMHGDNRYDLNEFMKV